MQVLPSNAGLPVSPYICGPINVLLDLRVTGSMELIPQEPKTFGTFVEISHAAQLDV